MSDLPTPSAQEPPRTDRAGWLSVITVLAVLALVTAIVSATARGTGSGAETDTAGTKTVDVELFDLGVKPSSVEVAKGTTLQVKVKNTGAMQHNLALKGASPGEQMLAPGASATIDYGAITESTSAWCTVPGHREAGMELKIVVTASAGGGTATAAAAPATGFNPDDATIDFNAKPGADWKPRDPTLPAALPGTVHDIDIHAKEVQLEVAPGVTQQMWTFDGTVPGPIYRGKVGDQFNITLYNDAGNQVDHSIDFHASKVAWDKKMASIKPGEKIEYPFRADYAGVFMFHCGTSPALHHIGNGMYGMIIIEPPDLPKVDKELFLVQSELYTGPQGQPGDLAKMKADAWDAVVFNGYVNQYKHQPIRVEPNQRIRVWVVDDGPSENSAFHVVGTVFDTVWKEGSYLLRPDQRQGGSQVLDLQPAQGGFVELSFAEPGLYPIVTHKFSNASQGALGLFQAGDVTMPAGAGH